MKQGFLLKKKQKQKNKKIDIFEEKFEKEENFYLNQ